MLPPGCGTLPGEEEYPCEICGGNPDSDECICPECEVCGAAGDPYCYDEGHLTRTQEQIDQLAKFEKEWADDHAREDEFLEGIVEDLTDEDMI